MKALIQTVSEYKEKIRREEIVFLIKFFFVAMLGILLGIFTTPTAIIPSSVQELSSFFLGMFIACYILNMDDNMTYGKKKVSTIMILTYTPILFMLSFLPAAAISSFAQERTETRFYVILLCFYWAGLFLVHLTHRKKYKQKRIDIRELFFKSL